MTRHLLSLDDLADEELVALLDAAEAFASAPRPQARLAGKIVCTAFFEPSTRTRLSFEAAAHRLGADVIGFGDAGTTSAAKGESLADTLQVLAGYADLLVVRTPEEGGLRGIDVDVPLINAGDGAGEHPTQTLVDLYTLRRHFGRLDGLRVAVVGDLRFGRTVHSLVPALGRVGASVVAVPAPGLALPPRLGRVEEVGLDEAAAGCDVLYVTRVQRERFADAAAYEAARGSFRIDEGLLARTGSKAIVLHPLPRLDEVDPALDRHPAAKYFEQARNGVPVRMAVLSHLLEETP